VWLIRVAELFGYDFQTILHFADVDVTTSSLLLQIFWLCSQVHQLAATLVYSTLQFDQPGILV
jgi:hypothetical protein